LEVTKGLVAFTRLSDGKTVDVAGGQYATAAEGVELAALVLPHEVMKVPTAPKAGEDPKPLTHLYGKVIFEDDFRRGLENWDVVVFGKDGTCEIAPPDIVKYVSIGQVPLWRKEPVLIVSSFTGSKMPRNTLLGIRSKKEIPAERFVLQMQIGLGQGAREGSECITTGIESRDEDRLVIGDKGDSYWTGGDYHWEFTPSDGKLGRNSLLCRQFDLYVPRSEKEKKESHPRTSWETSWQVRPVSKKIVFGVMNRDGYVSRVTVRELGKDE
jgi:hypothetical protein